MSIEERRSATRVALPEPMAATLGTTQARLVELSASGARVEHDDRVVVFANSSLTFTWRDRKFTIPVRIARSEIAGRRGSALFYQSGIQFTDVSAENQEALSGLIYWAMTGEDAVTRIAESETAWTRLAGQGPPAEAPAESPDDEEISLDDVPEPQPEPVAAAEVPAPQPAPRPAPGPVVFGSNPFMSGGDDDEPRFIRCTLGDGGWKREYVDTPGHPEQGFTVPIEQRADVDGLMRSYEMADPDTRGMIRAALG